jgi:hypothetical protein
VLSSVLHRDLGSWGPGDRQDDSYCCYAHMMHSKTAMHVHCLYNHTNDD